MRYEIIVKDIKDISKPIVIMSEIVIESDSKSCAIDEAHRIAEEKWPKVKRLVEVRQI